METVPSEAEPSIAANRISVLMPCYNAAAYLREAIDSVLNQTYPEVELIVVDDGSTDDSKMILAGLSDRLVLLEQDNQGPYPARNLGLQHATGEFVAFLDADDWWDESFLEKMHAALIQSDAALSYCGWQNVGLPGPRGEPHVPPDYELEDKAIRFLRAAAPWPIHAALVKRTVMDEVGGFDVNWPTCMDYDLWLRIAVGRRIQLVPETLAYYRHHKQGQITSTQWRQAQNSWLVKKKFVERHPEQVSHIPAKDLDRLINGGLLRRGYDNYWRRDLVSARRIFRMALMAGGWGAKDLKYLLPALLPEKFYTSFVDMADRGKTP